MIGCKLSEGDGIIITDIYDPFMVGFCDWKY